MRKAGSAALAVCVALLAGAFGQAAEPKATIDAAIKAAGGAEKLAKFNTETWKEKGTYYGMGAGQPYTGTYAVVWPDKFRMEIEGAFIIVLNGDKGWMKEGDNTSEMTKEQLEEQKENHYAGWVASLLPLKDKAFTLAAADEIKVDNRPAVGVKVSRKDHRDVNLYFDKETGLLVKSATRAKDLEAGGKEFTQEVFLSDYKEIEGAKVPMKVAVKRDGKQFVEAENLEVKPSPKLDDKTFAKP
jgi:hypothetical protein